MAAFLTASTAQWAWGVLALALVLLTGQQWWIFRLSRRSRQREELFRIVTENAADMIALVDVKGQRLYNSPAYKRILGYSAAELGETSAFEQIHPEDRYKVLEAAREARGTGVGKNLQYRIRHKDGSWRVLESTASAIRNQKGEVAKLVIVNRDITERKRAEEQLEHNSFHDGLTGLPNRRLLFDRLQQSFVRAQRNSDYRYAILFVDVDGFKLWNEKLGSAAGDQLILEIGRRLASCLRQDDTIARPKSKLPASETMLSRLGGDEFTILLEGITDPSDAMRIARRMQDAVAAPIMIANQQVLTSVSIGIALNQLVADRAEDLGAKDVRAKDLRAEDLLQDAETALHRAKALGGSRCEVFDEGMHSRAVSRLKLETELRTALERHQFRVFYQPIVRLATNQIAGFEALVRWQHPEQGLISPYKFLEAAEDMGLLVSLGKWVVREACRQGLFWQSKYPSIAPLSVTVNLSSKQFSHPHLVSDLKAAIQETGIEPGRLQLEVTESVAMADSKTTFSVFSQLKRLGLRISIDDFGIGYSSLSWLRRLPIDGLKIDRSLITTMPSDRASADVVQLIITLAKDLKLQATAEGIEAATQLDRVRRLGCEFGQGFFFSQPMEVERAEEALWQQSLRAGAAGAK